MIHVRSIVGFACSVALLLAMGGVAFAKVTDGTVMVPGIEVRETPEHDSATVLTLQRGTRVLLSKVPAPAPGWLHVMIEDESAELRHGYVPVGTVGILTWRTSTDAYATAHDGAAFPELRTRADLASLKCKRIPRAQGRLESCIVHYAVQLTSAPGFAGSTLTSCTTTLDFLSGDGRRATTSEEEQLELSSITSIVEGSVEVAAPPGGDYNQAAFSAIECRIEKAMKF